MPDLSWMSQPFAHRGLHDPAKGIVENTRSAVQAAIDHGFGFETDLRLASCGEVMVFHDARLDRLIEATGNFDQYNKEQLQALTFKGTSDKMMSLPEMLALVEGKVPLLLESKSDWQMSQSETERFVRNIARPLQTYSGHFAVMSFDPAIVAAFRKLAPEIPRGLISERYNDGKYWHFLSLRQRLSQRFLLSFSRTHPDFIAYNIKALPAIAPLIARHLFKCPLLTWTVRTPAQQKRAQRYCDAMIFEGFVPPMQQSKASRSP
ncbi:MAG: glycerophosphodiester phosphodiesterase [Hyphomicrobiaceae bacterium]|nr:glycerophosphodiester phosphodiesterase [Hyphomicrobiaceae bacterium]